MNRLFIVESPTKIESLKKFVSKTDTVLASKGHIMELAKGGKYGIGVNLTNFRTTYLIIPEKQSTVEQIVDAAYRADEIYLATDPDREGEAISHHLYTRLETFSKPIKRIAIKEITKKGFEAAMEKAGALNQGLLNSQEARRVLDRIIGFMVSPYLINNFGPNLSAGRVQSVAVKILSDRENEIKQFKPIEYWLCQTKLKTETNENFIVKYEDKLNNKQEAETLKAYLESTTFFVSSVIKKEEKKKPEAPLKTSTLQQVMANKFKMSAEDTMKAAQSLYERGLISYMRTDSVRISEDAIKEVRSWLKENSHSIPSSGQQYIDKVEGQDAHECIRPTTVTNTPDSLTLTDEEKKVYQVIWKFFVASQMSPAIFNTLEVKVKDINKKYQFRVSGKAIKSNGYLDIFDLATKKYSIDIPNLEKNQPLTLFNSKSIDIQQKFTQPPPRFNEASLIKELEEKKIGRPATYATILSTITNRSYVEKGGSTGMIFTATELGNKITNILEKYFSFLDTNYSAIMEDKLDQIESGKLNLLEMLNQFYNEFKKELSLAYQDSTMETSICDKCSATMIVRENKSNGSKFNACISCKNTKNIAA